ncbi:agmatine deiminase family protein [Puniceicoccus vermicola]|uniref:Agmatine deiminase family protein n=1 Tax=Puniceicoccus vermicola TaxID=388746 RepID=A0A7X1B0T8_9BACT|nr:agmatine deiminase family protein [Puniceicoccus vermicola]
MSTSDNTRRMPAEWEPHAGTWIFWPTRPEQYLYGSASDFSTVRDAFQKLVDVLCSFEPVKVGADASVRQEAESILGRRATVHEFPLDDAWARDAAPTFIFENNDLAALCWRFTGWGGRFGPIEADAKASSRIAEGMGLLIIRSKLALEGGGIHSNGQGTILTTTPVLEDPGRNPGVPSNELQEQLATTLGASHIVSLPRAYAGDDTGGHIDVIAAFAPSGAVLINDCTDSSDPNVEGSRENIRTLKAAGLEVISVPQPEARYAGGDRLAYSYLNFYLCNGGVIAPIFGDKKDDYFCGLLEEHFPDREVVPIDARPFYLGGGGIHCVTQQIPRA